ncbi:hypothetical protein AB0G32_40050, partial [Streptomyces sp. NPDC023723]|uniref:hypothetical protein n=1 Tax=Streptomyces sp. NPDC023723 TaxID=3154323 RepID=UPI0033EE4C1F
MISTRRIVAAAALAAGVTGLAALPASAADAGARPSGGLSPTRLLDNLAVSDLPAEHRDEILRPSDQLGRLKDLGQLRQVVGLVSPLFGVVPAFGPTAGRRSASPGSPAPTSSSASAAAPPRTSP